MEKRIHAFHMLNDYSGSPKILSLILSGLNKKGYQVDLYTSSRNGGFLSDISGINYHGVSYYFFENKVVTGLLFLIVQTRYFFRVLTLSRNSGAIIYINTILPFGAAIAARLKGLKVIYHIHEYPVRKNIIHKIAIFVFKRCADRAIFVSEYLYKSYLLPEDRKTLVYNSLSPDFIAISHNHHPSLSNTKNIMMACSLKVYKGVRVFIELAGMLPGFSFYLILNANERQAERFFKGMVMPTNLRIICRQNDLHSFYRSAHLIMNLTLPDLCIESFGLTILEAMAYGIPAIVPYTGGITELVDEGFNGHRADPYSTSRLAELIKMIFSDKAKYRQLSLNARLKADGFSYEKMINKVEDEISNCWIERNPG